MKTKVCSKCNINKPISAFHKDKSRKDGVVYWCKDCKTNYGKIFRDKNKEKEQLRYKKYRNLKKKEISIKNKLRYRSNKSYYILKRKEYRLNNKQKLNKKARIYLKKRRKNNINFRLRGNLSSRIVNALKCKNKSMSTMFLIGCEIDFLKFHLQEQFTVGMSWDNYGKWHVDHIKPCASFDLSKPEQQQICFNYKNLQPLWAIDNLRKGSK